MGQDIPPELPPVEYGNDCLCCFDAGKTPKYVEVTFSGVQLCPSRTWPGGENVNKTFLLTQGAATPCVWVYWEFGNWFIALWSSLFICTKSRLIAHTTVGGIADYFDSKDVVGPCLKTFANGQLIGDCSGSEKGYNGTGKVYWVV